MLSYVLPYCKENFFLLFTLSMLYLFMYVCYRRKDEGAIPKTPHIYMMAFVLIVVSIVDYAEHQYYLLDYYTYARTVLSVIGYILRPMFGLFAVQTLEKDPKRRSYLWIPAIINAVIYCCALFTKWVFWYTSDNMFRVGPLYGTVFVTSLVYASLLVIKATSIFKNDSAWEGMILIGAVLGIAIATLIDTMGTRNTTLYPVLAITLSFYYAYLMRQETHVRELEQEIMLKEQQNQLMMSQIQPHFLYNTLATAAYLCEDDPELAEHTILQFSEYLRQNMKTIGNNEPVLFEEEIEHTKIYTEIEMLRFDNIEVIYDLDDFNFKVPALSIQPMVENAIRHGIRSRIHGVVRVHSYLDGNEHVVEIIDNGIGFDVNEGPKNDRPHIGLNNVKERIYGMSKGTMDIQSVIGEGTRITIRIPAEEDSHKGA